MPNSLGPDGLQIQTLAEILTEILDGTSEYPGMYAIYGADINVEPNSPDGQMLNIIAQAKIDVLEFLQNIFNSFDPDLAVGVQLDQRCAINGIQRRAGTYTTVAVNVTTTGALTLPGLDTAADAAFTVADGSGNQFKLASTYAFVGAGTQLLTFRAALLGAIETTPNTITQIVTVTAGVSGVNNPAAGTTGVNEESDAALRIRRAKSVSLPSKGFLEGLYGALLSIEGVTSALVLENVTNAVDADGVPAHGIWCIVNGGTDAEVAQAIYTKRNAGCDMKGGESVDIVQADGTEFEILFDRPIAENLYIEFDVVAITGSVDVDYIRAQLVDRLSYAINEQADSSAIVAILKEIAPNGSFSAEGVSNDDVTYDTLLANDTKQHQWAVAAARVKINGSFP